MCISTVGTVSHVNLLEAHRVLLQKPKMVIEQDDFKLSFFRAIETNLYIMKLDIVYV